jgi:hypothetical protein
MHRPKALLENLLWRGYMFSVSFVQLPKQLSAEQFIQVLSMYLDIVRIPSKH